MAVQDRRGCVLLVLPEQTPSSPRAFLHTGGEFPSQCGLSGCANTAGACGTGTQCQSVEQEVTAVPAFWEMGSLTEGPVVFPASATKGEDIEVEMQRLVSV